MLTPVDVQNKIFKGGIGYDKRDVEYFMKELSSDYEKLYRSNVELKDKVSTLNESIQHYRSIEDSMQKALAISEKTAEETLNAANDKIRQMNLEAEKKAEAILAEAQEEVEQTKLEIQKLQQQYELYKEQFTEILNAQLQIINENTIGTDSSISHDRSERGFNQTSNQASTSDTGLGGLGVGGGYTGNSDRFEGTNQEPSINRTSLDMDPFASAANGGGRFSSQTGKAFTGKSTKNKPVNLSSSKSDDKNKTTINVKNEKTQSNKKTFQSAPNTNTNTQAKPKASPTTQKSEQIHTMHNTVGHTTPKKEQTVSGSVNSYNEKKTETKTVNPSAATGSRFNTASSTTAKEAGYGTANHPTAKTAKKSEFNTAGSVTEKKTTSGTINSPAGQGTTFNASNSSNVKKTTFSATASSAEKKTAFGTTASSAEKKTAFNTTASSTEKKTAFNTSNSTATKKQSIIPGADDKDISNTRKSFTAHEEAAFTGEVEDKVNESTMLDSEDNYNEGFRFMEDTVDENKSNSSIFDESETAYSGEVEDRVNESTMLGSEDNYDEGFSFLVGNEEEEEDIPTIFADMDPASAKPSPTPDEPKKDSSNEKNTFESSENIFENTPKTFTSSENIFENTPKTFTSSENIFENTENVFEGSVEDRYDKSTLLGNADDNANGFSFV